MHIVKITISKGASSRMSRRTFSITSLTLKLGILVDQPVPIPDAPLISDIGKIGQYLQNNKVSHTTLL